MSTSDNTRVERYLSWIAGLLAAMVLILPASAYYFVSVRHLAGSLEVEAQAKAAIVMGYIARNPQNWRLQTERLDEAMHLAVAQHHATRLVDQANLAFAEFGGAGDSPHIIRRSPVFDFGAPAGYVEIRASTREIFEVAMAIAVGCALLAALVFVPLRRIPIRALRRATRELKKSELRHRVMVDALADGVLLVNADLVVAESNPAAAAILGCDPDLGGKRVELLLPDLRDEGGEDGADFVASLREVFSGGRVPQPCLLSFQVGDGRRKWARFVFRYIPHDEGASFDALAISFTDVTERVESDEKIRFLASHDPLTRLPNRLQLLDWMQAQISRARRHDERIGVLLVDLDHFKDINDTRGHRVGDEILRLVAQRLRASLRQEDFVARIGGDEFVVVTPGIGSPEIMAIVAGKLLEAIRVPYVLGSDEFNLTPSIGVSVFPEGGDSADVLITNADIAMHAAKQGGRANFQFHAVSMNATVQHRLDLTSAMRRGLAAGEFQLYYQPKVLAADGSVVGAEALLRWKHPQRGFVSPVEFIPVAEESRLIIDIGTWVIDEARRQSLQWERDGLVCPPIAVNVSAMQFRQPDFLLILDRIRGDGGARIELEITESVLIDAPETVIERMRAIKARGFALSLDDFGTGYSSLSYLTRFPIDTLKIDQSFVRKIAADPVSMAIVEAIIRLAKSLGLKVIAEGVETEIEADLLRGLACDQFQGYHYARPMAAADFRVWLEARFTPSAAAG